MGRGRWPELLIVHGQPSCAGVAPTCQMYVLTSTVCHCILIQYVVCGLSMHGRPCHALQNPHALCVAVHQRFHGCRSLCARCFCRKCGPYPAFHACRSCASRTQCGERAPLLHCATTRRKRAAFVPRLMLAAANASMPLRLRNSAPPSLSPRFAHDAAKHDELCQSHCEVTPLPCVPLNSMVLMP